MWRTSRFRRIAVIGGVVALVMAAAWELVGIPALVKYPSDLDATLHLTGTFTSLMDPNTGAAMPNPMHLSLVVDQRVQSQGKGTGAHHVLVKETIDQRIGGQLIHAVTVNTYVMDRRSLKSVKDARAYSGVPANVLNRNGTYRVNLPFGLNPKGTYRIYENDIAGSFPLKPDTKQPTETMGGLKLVRFVGGFDYTPITATHFNELNAVMPMPKTLTLQQLAPALKTAGIDLQGAIGAVGPYLSPADRATLLQQLGAPVPLRYLEWSTGGAGVDQTTGAIVDLRSNVKLAAQPVLTGLTALDQVLARHPDVPQAVSTRENLTKLQGNVLLPVFEYGYSPNLKLLPGVTSKVKSMKSQLTLAQRTVPIGLLALAALAFVLGGLSWAGGRRRGPAERKRPAPVSVPEPVSATPLLAPAASMSPAAPAAPAAVAAVAASVHDARRETDRRDRERRDNERRNSDRRNHDRRDHERRAVA
jgi:hypothetical protein